MYHLPPDDDDRPLPALRQEAALQLPEPDPVDAEASAREMAARDPVCPRCQLPLKARRHATGLAWHCGGCGGESLNFSQFRRLIPELNANEIWMTAMEQPVAPRRRALCPECRRDMAAVLIPWQDREIELDICRQCQRLWMDSRENQQYRIDTGEPGRKPPVIRMTGRGIASLLGRRDSTGSRKRGLDTQLGWKACMLLILAWMVFMLVRLYWH